MARRKKDDAAQPAKSNGYEPKHVRSAVERIENLQDDIASIMSEAMNKCKAVHADIKIVLDEAKKEHGIPKAALKSVLKVRSLERKAEKVRDDLEPEIQTDHDMIRHALGDLADLPLGQAALGRNVHELHTGNGNI